MARLHRDPEPLDNYTTAQQLGALRRELLAEGFTEEQAMDIVNTILRYNLDFTVRFADIIGEPLRELPDVETVREEAVAAWETRSEELAGAAAGQGTYA
jgi:hypothetical protein